MWELMSNWEQLVGGRQDSIGFVGGDPVWLPVGGWYAREVKRSKHPWGVRPYERGRGWSVSCVNPSVSFADSSLYTREPWVRWCARGAFVSSPLRLSFGQTPPPEGEARGAVGVKKNFNYFSFCCTFACNRRFF